MAETLNEVLLITSLKLKEYFGPVRTEPRRLILSLIFLISMALPAALLGYATAVDPSTAPVGGPAATASTGLALFLAAGLLTALSGGIMVWPMELDFVLTSPVGVRNYLRACLLFQMLITQLTTIPFVPTVVGFALGRGLSAAWVLLAVAAFQGFLLFSILAAQALGMLVMTHGRWAKALVACCIIFLTLPVIGMVAPFPRFEDLPFPSTLYVATLALAAGRPTTFPWAPVGLSAYLLAGLVAHGWMSRGALLPYLRPGTTLGFGDAFHMGAPSARGEGGRRRATRALGHLRAEEGSVLRVLLRFHLLRMARERGIVAVFAFFLLLLLVPSLLSGPSTGTQVATSAVLYTSMLGPMLTASWSTTERPNLWIPLSSGGHGSSYFRALFAAFVLFSVVLPAFVLAVATALQGSPPPWALTALPLLALGSSGIALLLALRRPTPTPGLSPVGVLLPPILGSYLVAAPALLTVPALAAIGPWATGGLMALYTATLAVVLWYLVGILGARAKA